MSKADIINQINAKKIDKVLDFLTLKGWMHFKGENLRNINNIKNIKLMF